IIVLSDGMTDAADFKTLVDSMTGRGISVSTVAIGRDADIALMADIARWGKGRSYFSDDPQRIPKIFTAETEIVARELITERDLQPRPTTPHALLHGFAEIAWPPIRGQVVTYPKPEARVLLDTDAGPLLAAWRYGLGHSAAFTADLAGRWGKAWTAWDHYGRFAAQLVKWTQKKQAPHAFSASITRQGADGGLTVDVLDAHQRLVNHLRLQARVLYPDGGTRTIALEQAAPGRYQGTFAAEATGEYYVSLFGIETDDLGRPPVFGFGIPYTDEFSRTGIDHALLERLAGITGGRVLDVAGDVADLFTAPSGFKDRGRPLWPLLTLAFVLLFIADVAVRKIMGLNPEEPGTDPTSSG
ncbi:MAG: glutamine amidotransferase, partial [Desulfobacterales bacterium]|nr:glutamine amidotransferase [Desulfobacterales bacterium]